MEGGEGEKRRGSVGRASRGREYRGRAREGQRRKGEKNYVIIYKIGIACMHPYAWRRQCGHWRRVSFLQREGDLSLPCGHRQEGKCGM